MNDAKIAQRNDVLIAEMYNVLMTEQRLDPPTAAKRVAEHFGIRNVALIDEIYDRWINDGDHE